MLHTLFPTPVYFSNVEISDKETDEVFNTTYHTNVGNSCSDEFSVLEKMPKLKTEVQKHIDHYVNEVINPDYIEQSDLKFEITYSWSNITESDQYHHSHSHANSFISGVVYIEATEGLDSIEFFKEGYQQLIIKPKDYNLWNSFSWKFGVKTGNIALFPSHLTHAVNQRPEGSPRRISIAFNVFPRGTIGDGYLPTKVSL
jgi:uncharacterized protein (TIGR02466 family)